MSLEESVKAKLLADDGEINSGLLPSGSELSYASSVNQPPYSRDIVESPSMYSIRTVDSDMRGAKGYVAGEDSPYMVNLKEEAEYLETEDPSLIVGSSLRASTINMINTVSYPLGICFSGKVVT